MVKRLLIVESTANYLSLFHNIKTIKYTNEVGEEVEEELDVDQASWEDISLSSHSESGVFVHLKPARIPLLRSKQDDYRAFKVDFLLIRGVVNGLPNRDSYKNLLFGFQHSNVSSVNSIQSVIWNLERPLMYSGLLSISKKFGEEKFPLIHQTYYPNDREMRINSKICSEESPIVVKASHVHEGYGKMLLKHSSDFKDLSSIVAIHEDYCTSEAFIAGEYDIRIQKIGNHYRAYKRMSAPGWKSSVSAYSVEDLPITEQYKFWADECSKLFGGMDILAIDAVRGIDGKEYILELNDCSVSLCPHHQEVDMLIIRDLTIDRMKEAFSKSTKLFMEDNSDFSLDSTGLYKKLEVDLMNNENKIIILERELQKSNSKIVDLISINKNMERISKKYFGKIFSTGLLAGLLSGGIMAYMLAKKSRT